MIRLRLALIGVLLLPAMITAQLQPEVTAVEIEVLPATGDPVTIPAVGALKTPISSNDPRCNRASVPAVTVNPPNGQFPDPFHANRFCVAPLPTVSAGTGYRGVWRLWNDSVTACQNAAGNTISPCRSERSALVSAPFAVVPPVQQPVATGVLVTVGT